MRTLTKPACRWLPIGGCIVALLGTNGRSQVHPDAWLLMDQGVLVTIESGVIAARVIAGGFARNLAARGEGVVFSTTYSGPALYQTAQIQILPGPLNAAILPLTTTFLNGNPHFAATRRRVFAVDFFGSLHSVLQDLAMQSPSSHGLLLGTPTPGQVTSVATNGRDLFFCAFDAATNIESLFAIDLEKQPLMARPIIVLPQGDYFRDVCMGRDGSILAMRRLDIVEIDPQTGAVTVLIPPSTSTPPINGHIAYNPWTDTVLTAGQGAFERPLSAPPGTPWQFLIFPFNPSITDCVTNAEPPFMIFGAGCPNSTGSEPRLGWTGVPLEGTTFSIELRDAEPCGLALIWLGLSDSFWAPVGQLPFSGATFGAPGCNLLVAPDASPVMYLVDPNGRATHSISVPIAPSLRGLQIFAQSLSSSTANPLGFSASDALLIRVR